MQRSHHEDRWAFQINVTDLALLYLAIQSQSLSHCELWLVPRRAPLSLWLISLHLLLRVKPWTVLRALTFLLLGRRGQLLSVPLLDDSAVGRTYF